MVLENIKTEAKEFVNGKLEATEKHTGDLMHIIEKLIDRKMTVDVNNH